MCSWSYLLLKTSVDYVMKKHINNNYHVLKFQLTVPIQTILNKLILVYLYV
jgi:hypothetical protein